jgi:hypothetical protein
MYGYSDLYNPMINPYLPNAGQSPYQQAPKQEVVKVNGENGARAFPMGPSSSALLLDESGVIVWLVVTDGAGYKTVAPYDITPHKTTQSPDYSTLEERIKRLEEFIDGFTDDTATAGRTDGKPGDGEPCTDKKNGERR